MMYERYKYCKDLDVSRDLITRHSNFGNGNKQQGESVTTRHCPYLSVSLQKTLHFCVGQTDVCGAGRDWGGDLLQICPGFLGINLPLVTVQVGLLN